MNNNKKALCLFAASLLATTAMFIWTLNITHQANTNPTPQISISAFSA